MLLKSCLGDVMNEIKKYAVKVGLGIVIDVMKDAITLERIKEAREWLINAGDDIADLTITQLDDKAWEIFAEKVLTPENWAVFGSQAIDWMIEFVKDSTTTIDDTYALPLLLMIKKVMSMEDANE